jgi:hypothetical protein
MFENLYGQIEERLQQHKCNGCIGDNICRENICNDLNVMYKPRQDGNYIEEYNCNGKTNSFVKRYGAAYISEIYHYLENSKILEPFKNSNLSVLALGSGFDPWYYAIKKYSDNRNLNINLDYTGYDKSENWAEVRPPYQNVRHYNADLTDCLNIDFNRYNFIIADKVFSTIRKTTDIERINTFLQNISQSIHNLIRKNHKLIFREQACARDIYTFDFFMNNNINWDSVNYFYIKGRYSEHLEKLTNHYKNNGKNIYEIYNKNLIYDKRFNNGSDRLGFNTFFIQYNI